MESEFKGTKGNWRIFNDFKVGTGVKNICEIYNSTSNESRSNAKLIAAAPELLEALEVIKKWSNSSTGFTSKQEKIDRISAKAQEVIEKALN